LHLAHDSEAAGFDALYTADHPGTGASPFVALAAAAGVTERISLGTCVVNAGVWEPLALAGEVSTLDAVSHGRALLGVGAGHTPLEWTARGLEYPSPGARVGRMIELVEATTALLDGQRVSYAGRYLTLVDAELGQPRPVQDRVRLMVGGGGARVLRFAATHADIVGITGLGRTLEDGHKHEVAWDRPTVTRSLERVAAAAADVGRTPQIEALVQVVEVTDDAQAVAQRVAPAIPGTTAEHLLDAPFVWIGTLDEIRNKIERFAQRGIDRYVIRAGVVDDVRRIFSDLSRG
jgi:probable F420-dependent oxidoreductase